jgi:carbamoyltransferase
VAGRNLQVVALAHKPRLHADRVLRNALAYAPGGWARFADDAARWRPAAGLPALLRRRLDYRGPLLHIERPEALALAALDDSAPETCAVLLAAARGERSDGALGVADGATLTLRKRLDYPHGLGPLWAAFGHYLALADPWRELPALAAGGSPRFAPKILERLVDLKADGSLRLDLGYFSFCASLEPTNPRFWALFERPPRQAGDPPGRWAADVAASLQAVTVEALRRMAEEARAQTGLDDLCLAGDAARSEPLLEALRAAFRGRLHAGGPEPGVACAVGAAAAAWRGPLRRGRPSLPPSAWAAPAAPAAPRRGPARPALRRLGAVVAGVVLACAALTRPGPWLAGFELALAALLLFGAWAAPETLGELTAAAALSSLYFLVLTPASLLARTLGLEPLPERWRARGSYWTAAA